MTEGEEQIFLKLLFISRIQGYSFNVPSLPESPEAVTGSLGDELGESWVFRSNEETKFYELLQADKKSPKKVEGVNPFSG